MREKPSPPGELILLYSMYAICCELRSMRGFDVISFCDSRDSGSSSEPRSILYEKSALSFIKSELNFKLKFQSSLWDGKFRRKRDRKPNYVRYRACNCVESHENWPLSDYDKNAEKTSAEYSWLYSLDGQLTLDQKLLLDLLDRKLRYFVRRGNFIR